MKKKLEITSLGSYRDFTRGYIAIMEKKMETMIL